LSWQRSPLRHQSPAGRRWGDRCRSCRPGESRVRQRRDHVLMAHHARHVHRLHALVQQLRGERVPQRVERERGR